MFVRRHADGQAVCTYFYIHCICGIGSVKIKILYPENVQNDVLHATIRHQANMKAFDDKIDQFLYSTISEQKIFS